MINFIFSSYFFCNYFVLDYLFDFNKSCTRFVDIFYVHKDRMKKIYNHFENNYNYDFYCTVNYEIKNVQNQNNNNLNKMISQLFIIYKYFTVINITNN